MHARRFDFDYGSHVAQHAVVQAKLVVGPPGDRYEREADRIARAVARGEAGPGARGVQAVGGAAAGAPPRDVLHSQIRAASAGGRGHRIPGRVRAPLEQALGADLSGVRVHADTGADRLSRSLRANALTTGQDIFFRRGTYAPGSRAGNALLAHELVHVLQQRAGPPGAAGAVQLKRPEDFNTYADAKDANKYSQALLDQQRNGAMEDHIGKGFGTAQRTKIYTVNKAGTGQITSDTDGSDLFLQDTAKTPHVDHRYPKAKAGRNSYANAAVIPARVNIAKSDKLTLQQEPDTPLRPYRGLKDPTTVLPGMNFSKEQKDKIYEANIAYYKKGCIVSDADRKTKLSRHDSAEVPHVDHITAASSGGSNFYFNARVISAEENIEKGGERGGKRGENQYDWLELRMTLQEFIDFKRTGTQPGDILDAPTSPTSDDDSPKPKKKRRRSGSDSSRKRQRKSSKGGGRPRASSTGSGSDT